MSTTDPQAPGAPEAPQPPQAPAAQASTDSGPRASGEEIRDLGRLRRIAAPHRKIAGVAGGLARHLDVDPVILRVAFVVLVFFGGSGLLLYAGVWLLVPEDGAARAPLHLGERTRVLAVLMVAAVSTLALLGDSVGQFDFPWPLVPVLLLALVVLAWRDRHQPHPGPPPPPPYAAAYAPGWPVGPVPPQQPTLGSRRRGPLLFWFAMSASALLIGTLAVLDLAGVPVADPVYPAGVVVVCGLALLVGAFWGRAGGLTLVGLLAAAAMGVSAASSGVQAGDVFVRPTSAAAVPDRLTSDAGDLVLDLTAVTDLQALDGRTLVQRLRVGRIEVIVPADVTVRVRVGVRYVGSVQLPGRVRGGFGVDYDRTIDGPPGSPTLTIDARASVGEIAIRHAQQEDR